MLSNVTTNFDVQLDDEDSLTNCVPVVEVVVVVVSAVAGDKVLVLRVVDSVFVVSEDFVKKGDVICKINRKCCLAKKQMSNWQILKLSFPSFQVFHWDLSEFYHYVHAFA